jgi:hypothetical protein
MRSKKKKVGRARNNNPLEKFDLIGKEGPRNDPGFQVLNPSGLRREAAPTTVTPRIPDLNGKVIYCISQHIGGADIFLKKIAEVLPQIVPGVKTIYERRETAYMTDDPELWSVIVKEADAVIYGCGA